MPDFTGEPVKMNPQGPGNPTIDPNEPTSDWSGYVPAGGPMGLWSYKTIGEVLADEGAASATPSPINHVTAEARFTDADGAGVYLLGHGVKMANGSGTILPQIVTVDDAYMAAFPNQKWVVGAVFAVNGTPIPSSLDIDVGFYRVTVGGGADAITYTLSGTGKIVETYGAGIGSGVFGQANPDRRADFVAAGDQNYALGVELSTAMPADCVMDLSMALQLSPY